MASFNVLFLEHGPERAAYRNAIAAAPARVEEIEFRSETEFLQQLETKLAEQRFELVVTDAFFLPHNESHQRGGASGTYMLDHIVERVRAASQHRTRIAVLTGFGDELLEKPDSPGLNGADYIWPKPAIRQPFLTWQVRHVCQEFDRRFPTQTLVEVLLDLIASHRVAGTPMPWSDSMEEMLQNYKSSRGEMNQVTEVRGLLASIAEKFKFGQSFEELFDAFEKSESIQVAAKPKAWGHLRHVLHVFWLGYLVLNSGVVDAVGVWRSVTSQTMAEDDKMLEQINFAWFLAALFHDIGLLGERLSDLVESCNEIVEIYPVGSWNISASPGYLHSDNKVIDTVGRLGFRGKLGGWFNQVLSKLDGRIDHGVLSAMTILNRFGNSTPENIALSAARAAALHNVAKNGFKKEYPDLPNVEFQEEPIAALLLICDQLQVWDRETGLENAFSEFPLECAEMSPIEISVETKKLTGRINYYAFREILPQQVEMKKLHRNIQKKILADVNPLLRKVTFGMDPPPRFEVTFNLEGQKIEAWDSAQ